MKRQNEIKLLIARKAAQLLYDEGLSIRQAKRKAAKPYGSLTRLEHSHCLPSNQDIYTHLLLHASIHDGEGSQRSLTALRRRAIAVLKLLHPFHPYIVGDVADGIATPFSVVSVILYADHPDEIEDYLWQHEIHYESLEEDQTSRLPLNGSYVTFELNGGDVECLLLPRSKCHRRMRSSLTGNAIRQLTCDELELLI